MGSCPKGVTSLLQVQLALKNSASAGVALNRSFKRAGRQLNVQRQAYTLYAVLVANVVVWALLLAGMFVFRFWGLWRQTEHNAASTDSRSRRKYKAPPAPEQCTGKDVQRPLATAAQLFFGNAKSDPSRCALIVLGGEQRRELSYGSLSEGITNMAKQLMQLGVKPGDRVLLRVHRGLHQMLAVYACMSCGAIFVPVDPDVPDSWLEHVVKDTEAVLLVEEKGKESNIKVKHVEAPADGSALTISSQEVPQAARALPEVKPADPAVIFYTSGSTGTPKGILHSHAQLQNAAFGIAEDANVKKGSIVLLRSPAVWSTYEWEAFPALMVGATLVVADPHGHKDPAYLAKVLEEESVNMLAITPKSLDLVLDAVHQAGYQLSSLADVASTGEQLPTTLANRFIKTLPHARLHNGYNPSESAACTWYTLPAAGLDPGCYPTNVPAGRPQPGVSVYIMDPDSPKGLRQLGEGEEGEILLGGLLSEGYWKRPELDAEKFVQSKIGRLYHTGDKGKWEDGMLITFGRIDRQLKIHGVRVEPEEVEAVVSGAWSELRQRRAAAAPLAGAGVACVASSGENPELVAIVAPLAEPEEMRLIEERVKAALPAYYHPSRFHTVPELPATATGKVDLKAAQAIATELVSQAELVEDSIGMMRILSMDHQTIFRCYSLFSFTLIWDHWYNTGKLSTQPGWVELVVEALGNNFELYGFLSLMAFNDSKPEPGQAGVRLGTREAVLLWAYLLIGLTGAAYASVAASINPDAPFSTLEFEETLVGHTSARWFLYSIFLARLLLRICQFFADITGGDGDGDVDVRFSIVVHFAALLVALHTSMVPVTTSSFDPLYYNPCGSYEAKMDRCPVLVRILLEDLSGSRGEGWPEFTQKIYWFVVLYMLAYIHSHSIVKVVRDKLRKLRHPIYGIVAFLLYWAMVTTQASTPTVAFEGEWMIQMTLVLLCVYVASWIPVSAQWTGQAPLGLYATHLLFPAQHLFDFLQGHFSGLLLLMSMGLAVVLYMVIIGPIAQSIVTKPVTMLGSKLSSSLQD